MQTPSTCLRATAEQNARLHCWTFMIRPTSPLDIVDLGRIVRARDVVDDRLPLRVRLALCHLMRAEEERKASFQMRSGTISHERL